MKIGLVIYDDLGQVSGGYLYDRKLVDHFRDRGDTMEVLSLPYRTYLRHVGDNFSRSFRERLLRGGWDVLLQDELNHPSLFLLNRFLKGRVRYPVVSVVHHLRCDEEASFRHRCLYRNIEVRYLTTLDGCVFNSRTVEGRVRELLGRRLPSIVAYPGRSDHGKSVTAAVIRERIAAGGPLRILFLGNVIERKGLYALVEALSRVHVRWRLEVVGDLAREPGYVCAVRALVDGKRLGSLVRFHGQLARDEIGRMLRRSHLLAVPSRYEGFGIVYLEALGCGVPVIASARGGASEMVTDGREGFLVAPDDARTLQDRLELLGRDRELLVHMSVDALRRHQAFPCWEESMAAVRGFLLRVTERPR